MKLWELYQEGNCSTIEHNGHLYSVDKLLRAAENVDIEEFEIDDLKWILKHVDKLDPKRVEQKRIKYPILITKTDNRLIVLDGIHRLVKAIKLGHTKIKGRYINHETFQKTKLQ